MKAISLKAAGAPGVSGTVGVVRAAIRRNALTIALIGAAVSYAGALADCDIAMFAGALVVVALEGILAGKGGER